MQTLSTITVGILCAVVGILLFTGVAAPAWSESAPRSRQPWDVPSDSLVLELPAADLEVTRRESDFRQALADDAIPLLTALASETKTIQAALKANLQNALTASEIEAIDRRWRLTKGRSDALVRSYLEHPLTARFAVALETHSRWREVFLMDARGCIVAESHKTSDFWQGDEAKWIESFAGGEGNTYIGEIDFDVSIQAIVLQVAVPIFNNQGQAIGVLCVSLGTDA